MTEDDLHRLECDVDDDDRHSLVDSGTVLALLSEYRSLRASSEDAAAEIERLRAESARREAKLNDARGEVLSLCGFLGLDDGTVTLADAVRLARVELEKEADHARMLKADNARLRDQNARLRDDLGNAAGAIRDALDKVGGLATECPGLAAVLKNRDEREVTP